MLVTFKTNSYADITMFGDAGESLLKMMGQSGNVPGAIMAGDVPAALQALKDSLAAVANGTSSSGTLGSGELSAASHEQDGEAPPVTLSTRALPLVELLEAAIASSDNVLWDK